MLYRISSVGLIILLVLLVGSTCGVNEPITLPPCPIETLMIDKSYLPEEMLWYQEIPSRRGAPVRWGVDKLGVGFSSQKNGGVIQDVYRGENFDQAEDGYFDLVTSWFDSREDETDWYIPSMFNYESVIADHFRFGCRTHKPSGVESCQMVGQYGIYVTRFRADISSIMTYEDLEHILQTIDDKMAQCLGK